MTKKKIILLCVVFFLLIVFFLPRQIDTYHQDGRTYDKYKTVDVLDELRNDPNGQSGYHTIPRIYFSLFHYFYEEYQLGKRYEPRYLLPHLINPIIIGEKQLLKEPRELTHEERFDLLTSASCEMVIHHHLSRCHQNYGEAIICGYYYQGARSDYCMFVYDETNFSDQECKMLQDRYFEYWWVELDIKKGQYLDYDMFAEYFCKKDPVG